AVRVLAWFQAIIGRLYDSHFTHGFPMTTDLKTRPAADHQFFQDQASLQQIAADVLKHARELGASACETEVSEGVGQTVTVRRGEVETIEYNRDKSIGVSVYLGQCRGHASTSDFTPKA